MVFSRSCQYAIRAMAHIAACEEGQVCRAQEIAKSQEIPAPFLSTVLQNLARAGLMKSYKGPKGGFCLGRPAVQITLYDILEALGSLSGLTRCAIGLESCSGDMLCPLHDRWEPVRQGVIDYLQVVTVADMETALANKNDLQGLLGK